MRQDLVPSIKILWDGLSNFKMMKQQLFYKGHTSYIMSFEEWYDYNEEEVYIYLAETGADREMDYDSENWFDILYITYQNWAYDRANK